MIREKWHFLEFSFPSAGIFYADRQCKEALFIGQLEIHEDKIRIKVLERQKDYYSYGGTLYARLRVASDHHNIVSWSFFDCHFDGMHGFVEFKSFVKHDNHNTKGWEDQSQKNSPLDSIPIPKFITEDSKFKRISVDIESLDEWLWKHPLEMELKEDSQFRAKFIDKDGKSHRGCKSPNKKGEYEFDEDITHILIPTHAIKEKIAINEELTIELHSTPEEFGEYPNFDIYQSCRVYITSKTPKPMEYFYHVIYSLSVYFTAIGYRKCKIHSINYFKPIKFLKDNKVRASKSLTFYHNSLCWDIQKKKNDYWFTRDNLRYQNMQKDFDKSVKEFFEKKANLHNIIHFLADMDSRYDKGYLETYITQQVQLLETYGNMKLKGEYKKDKDGKIRPSENLQDLMKVMKLLPDDIFDKIFIHNHSGNPYRGTEVFGYENRDKPIKQLRVMLRLIITELRNFIVHPYKNGRHKELKDTKLPTNYYNDNRLNMRAISALSSSLNMTLRWFLFEEIGLEKYFKP